ncbi:DHA2 family efflux MFS transporter permease subunit [Micromonospora humida]|uniref:DHA2 family efflux MFS transporter permease subunit n=1 Tax=Micromonospora humida TaxID=2809018 RepID=UPI003401E200
MSRLRGNPWAVLATLSIGFFMTLLDLTIVNIAIPDVMSDLGASFNQVLWVISAYSLVLAVLLITTGRLGDLKGPRLLFLTGTAVFTVASIVCGAAQSPGQLIGARAVQGIGAAMMVPQTLAMIIGIFPPQRRGTAMGVWGAVAGVATISGPTLGGLLVSTFGWRSIFFVNVPLGIAVLVLTPLLIPNMKPDRKHSFDVVGVLIATAALFCVVFALNEGERYDWSVQIWALLAAGVVLIGVFIAHQRTKQDDEPLVPFALFRDRNYTIMSINAAVVSMAMLGLVLPMNLYLQQVLGMDALHAGLTLAPSPLVAIIVSPFAGRLSDRIGGKFVLLFGLTMYAIGMVILVSLAQLDSKWYTFVPGLLVAGLGTGSLLAPMATEAMRGVNPRLAGAASGLNNTVRQLGSVLGLAIVGALIQSRLATTVRQEATAQAGQLPADVRDRFVDAGVQAGAGGPGGIFGHLPGDLPDQLRAQIATVFTNVYDHAFLSMLKTNFLFPIAIVVVAAVLTTFVRRRPPAPAPTPPGTAVPAPAPAAAAVVAASTEGSRS